MQSLQTVYDSFEHDGKEKKEQLKLKSSYTRQGNLSYKEKIYRISIKSGLCVQHMERFWCCGSSNSSSSLCTCGINGFHPNLEPARFSFAL